MFVNPGTHGTISSARSRAGLPAQAVLALALILLGAAGHFAHHLLDPTCIDGQPSSSHACACSVLHGTALAEDRVAVAPSVPMVHSDPQVSAVATPATPIAEACAPRGPPLA